jgi:hypothetical protein
MKEWNDSEAGTKDVSALYLKERGGGREKFIDNQEVTEGR